MIIDDIRSIVNTTVSSRLCVLTGGAFIVRVSDLVSPRRSFFYIYVQRSRSCALHSSKEEKRKAKQKSSKTEKGKNSVHKNI